MVMTGALAFVLAAGAAGGGEGDAAKGEGDAAKGEGPRVAGVAPGLVDGATARKLVEGGVKVVDVRTPAEFAKGHVPGAINIPHDEVARRHAEIGAPSTPVLLYCRTGRRSELAARALREKGFGTIYDLQAYDAWVASEPRR
jgi:rhodanese-related sulfurtransferase